MVIISASTVCGKKMSLFEESARVPLLMAGPGITPKSVIPAPVGLVDVMPTLTEMCRVKTQAIVQGQSLVPMLKDRAIWVVVGH